MRNGPNHLSAAKDLLHEEKGTVHVAHHPINATEFIQAIAPITGMTSSILTNAAGPNRAILNHSLYHCMRELFVFLKIGYGGHLEVAYHFVTGVEKSRKGDSFVS